MAFSEEDIAIIERAIVSGEQRVRFSDGREVEYRSISDLLKALDRVTPAVDGATGRTRCTLASFTKD